MTMDDILTRVEGSVDLMRGKAERGWRRLDVSADGFIDSFIAIPVCVPAMLVTWLAHASFLKEQGAEGSVGGIVLSLAFIEVVIWVVTIAMLLVIAGPMNWRDRFVHTVIAVNWGSVVFAYARAVPSALALVVGLGDGIAFITLVVLIATLVAYARLLSAALERSTPIVAGVFAATLALGFVLSDFGHTAFSLRGEGGI